MKRILGSQLGLLFDAAQPESSAAADLARIRGSQIRAMLLLMPVASGGMLMLVAMTLLQFWHRVDHTPLAGWAVATVLINAANVAWWIRLRHVEDYSAPPAVAWAFGAEAALSAFLDIAIGIWFLQVTPPSEHLLVLVTMVGVVAAGGWLFAPLPQAGLGWVTAAVGVLIASVHFAAQTYTVPLEVLAVVYGVVLYGGVLMHSHLFLQKLVAGEQLRRQHQLVGLLLRDFEESTSDWLWETDATGVLRYLSRDPLAGSGGGEFGLIGRDLHAWLLRRLDAGATGAQAAAALLAQRLASGEPFRDLVLPVVLENGRQWWSLTAKPLLAGDGSPAGWRGVGADVTMERERLLELRRQAAVDPLTGLANRHQFNTLLHAHFPAQAAVHQCTLLLFDLDSFKQVNDSLGHDCGDGLLCEAARRLSAHAPAGALVARLGGDEFALLLPGELDADAAVRMAADLHAALAAECVIANHRLEISASVGIARAPGDADGAAQLLKRADLALYSAKASGRGAARVFEAQMERVNERRLTLLADLREAVRTGQFSLNYQPQLDLASGRLCGFEALLRWRHPQRGLVPPAEFIPLAEDCGLIVPIGRWVLEHACREAAGWPDALGIAVNISAVEFSRTDLRQVVAEVLATSGLPAWRLELELTESTLLNDSAAARALLEDLRGMGVRVALDDFGTGYSSLAYLQSFPLDTLKIDRSFVKVLDDEHQSTRALAIIESIQRLARALGLRTMAEGIESERQRDLLARIGIDHAQGYLFAPPLDLERTRERIRQAGGGEDRLALVDRDSVAPMHS